MIEQECLCCGERFITYKSNNRKYCSKKCAAKNNWEKRDKALKTELICEYCKKPFKIKCSETRFKTNKVHYCSRECSDKSKETGQVKKCKNCGVDFYTTRNDFCSKKCVYEYRKKTNKHKLYIEGGYLVKYIDGYNKKGNAKLHRLIVEENIGRKLKPNEVVHHIDGNKLNNNINNLQIMTASEHSKLHRDKELSNGKKLFGRS